MEKQNAQSSAGRRLNFVCYTILTILVIAVFSGFIYDMVITYKAETAINNSARDKAMKEYVENNCENPTSFSKDKCAEVK